MAAHHTSSPRAPQPSVHPLDVDTLPCLKRGPARCRSQHCGPYIMHACPSCMLHAAGCRLHYGPCVPWLMETAWRLSALKYEPLQGVAYESDRESALQHRWQTRPPSRCACAGSLGVPAAAQVIHSRAAAVAAGWVAAGRVPTAAPGSFSLAGAAQMRCGCGADCHLLIDD